MITIVGDDTLSYTARLVKEGVNLNAIPKTMDNDVYGDRILYWFFPPLSRRQSISSQNFRTSIGSHERIGVVELFGRNSGETALITGYLSYVDRTIISAKSH
jgi:6-phosphofructokinase 1